MRDKVLYFPQIRVPDSPWFTRILLYWQEVGTIVPYEFLRSPERLGKHTQDLVRMELVREVIPGQHIYKIPNFTSAFIGYLEEIAKELPLRRRRFRVGRRTQIHIEKMDSIAEELVKLGLATRKKKYSPWFSVEKKTADEFMAYLSSVLGQMEEVEAAPVSDNEDALSSFCSVKPDETTISHDLATLRMTVLEKLLPAPAAAIDPLTVKKFKEKHFETLRRFRRHVESELAVISAIDKPDMREYRLANFCQAAHDQIEEIHEEMKSHGWMDVAFGKLCAILSPLPVVGKAAGLLKAIHAAISSSPKPIEHLPFAYAAFVQNEFPAATIAVRYPG